MHNNKKITSKQVSSLAGKVLHSTSASQIAKSLAASALSQRQNGNQKREIIGGVEWFDVYVWLSFFLIFLLLFMIFLKKRM